MYAPLSKINPHFSSEIGLASIEILDARKLPPGTLSSIGNLLL
jgi:hypothetical protein